MKFVVALLLSCAAFVAGAEVARAVDPAQIRPFWTGYPSWLQECAGGLATLGGYGLIPARSAYTEIEYTNGAACNTLLGRPANWIRSIATSYASNGVSCHTATVYNSNGAATVVATANACLNGTASVNGTWQYLNSAAGNPSSGGTSS